MASALPVPVAKNLESVLRRIEAAYKKVEQSGQPFPELVAVSKTKQAPYVVEAYRAGQRKFGENYIQELVSKSHNEKLIEECPDIRWHYIGKLQSNKLKMLTSVPNLSMVETVSNLRMANLLDIAWQKVSPNPLDILIQVNTSNEEQKGGVDVAEVTSLFKSITETCSHLRLRGLMTIGQYDYDTSQGINPDFVIMEKRQAHFRILGAMIPRLVGREVCVLGKISSVAPGGDEFSMKCADGVDVKCIISSSIEPSTEGCVVEVQALVKNSNEIQATTEPIVFPVDASNNFDMERYCYAVNLTATFDRLYTQSMED